MAGVRDLADALTAVDFDLGLSIEVLERTPPAMLGGPVRAVGERHRGAGHVAQAARVMAKQYGSEVGPWVPLLPVLTDHPVPRS